MEKFKLARLVDCNLDISKTWYVEFYFEHPESGKLFQFKKYISKRLRTKAARIERGQLMKKEINERLMMGWNPFSDELPGKKSISSIIKEAVKRKKAHYTSVRSLNTVNDTYRKFMAFLRSNGLESITVDQFGKQQALRFLDWIMDHYEIGNYTRNNHLQNIKALFNYMVSRDWILVNPFSKIEKLPVRETPIRLFSRNDLKIIADKLPGYDYNLYVIAMLIYYCALRPQEIVRLRRSNFLIEHGLILASGDITKNTKSQTIAIPKAFLNELRAKDWDFADSMYVFSKYLRPGKIPIASTRIAEAWRLFCRKHGISDERKIYDLKHTGGGMAVDAGISMRDIQMQMRHSSLEITEGYLRKFTNTTSEKLIQCFPDFHEISGAPQYPEIKKAPK